MGQIVRDRIEVVKVCCSEGRERRRKGEVDREEKRGKKEKRKEEKRKEKEREGRKNSEEEKIY